MKTLLIIEVDHNDGDYITKINYINKKEKIFINKIVKAIKTKNHGHNWCTNERIDHEDECYPDPKDLYKNILTEKEIEEFNEYLPYNEYGIHTINSIRILNVESEKELI